MQSKRAKLGIGLFALWIAACDSPTEPHVVPCTGPCEGLDLTIDSVRVVFPSGQSAAFSGDTLRVIVHVTNRGTVATDSNTVVGGFLSSDLTPSPIASPWDADLAPIHPIRPGDAARFTLNLSYPATSASAQRRDSIYVQVYRSTPPTYDGKDSYYTVFDARYTRPFDITFATFELRNVPVPVRYPASDQAVDVVITNPTPNAIPPGTVNLCLYSTDGLCEVDGFDPGAIPLVPAGQTVTVTIPMRVVLTSRTIDMWRPWQGRLYLRACYEGSCRLAVSASQPVYENFCDVRRLQPNLTMSASTVGRCGKWDLANRLDIVSFEAAAGTSVTVIAGGAGLNLYTSTGDALGQTGSFLGGQLSFTASHSGRYYAFIVSYQNTEYTLRFEPSQ